MASIVIERSDQSNDLADRPFRFQNLPAELRNNVYSKVIESQPNARLKPRGKGKLASRSALARVNHQIRDEYLAVLYLTANIRADVTNFDITHIVTFFN